jgi:SAM-dependent methyltransferase
MKAFSVLNDPCFTFSITKLRFGGVKWNRLLAGSLIIIFFPLVELNAQNLDVPYVPTSEEVVELMLDVVNAGPGDYLIDLGSGDGRIVIAAAKRGAVGHGIDINPKRISEARENAVREKVENKVLFIEDNIFTTDFSRASVVTMYLLNSVNMKLRPHLLEKLRPGTRLVSHDFDMEDWKPDKHLKEGYSDVFYWVIPARAEGNWKWKTDGSNFSMSVKQQFQEIDVNVRSGNTALKTHDNILTGERISFSAVNPSNGNSYVFSGRIDGKNITGTVQVRNGDKPEIEKWNATLE